MGSFRRDAVKFLLISDKVHSRLLLLLLWLLARLGMKSTLEAILLWSELKGRGQVILAATVLHEAKAGRVLVGLDRVGRLNSASVVLSHRSIYTVEVCRSESAVWSAALVLWRHLRNSLVNVAGVAVLRAREGHCQGRWEGRASATAWIRLV